MISIPLNERPHLTECMGNERDYRANVVLSRFARVLWSCVLIDSLITLAN